ncbi:MAG: GntR family transcriptional regulator [Lautropia sp.]
MNVIRDRILDLTLAPSSRIDETLLAERFELSRTPAREALNRLASEGLVEIQHNRGAVVSPLDIHNIRDLFNAYFASERMVGFFCNTRQGGLVADLEALNSRYVKYVETREFLKLTEINALFHSRIARATENIYILEFAERLQNQARRISYYIFKLDVESERYQTHQHRVTGEHDAIIQAIKKHDNGRLVDLLTKHALLFQERVHTVMDASKGATGPLPVRSPRGLPE